MKLLITKSIFSNFLLNSEITSSVGERITSPLSPSNAIFVPDEMSSTDSLSPITQGIPRFLATITAWEVKPPSFKIIPETLFKFIDEVSAGVRSFAIRIVLFSNVVDVSLSCIAKMRCFPTEIMSSDLCLKYSSSIESKIDAVDEKTSNTVSIEISEN